MCRAFCGTIIARLARFHIAICRHLPNARTPSDHRSEGAKTSHVGYNKMIPPAQIEVKKISPIPGKPLPTKVGPTKVDMNM
jgi:hypothetical protein